METQRCPICLVKVQKSERYPNYVCNSCQLRASDAENHLLGFFNESFSGGFLAFYAGTDEKYDSHICYIDRIKCRADEARFGGIIIQPTND